jgi:glycosyltransferase involved in cell wall biosynthesis
MADAIIALSKDWDDDPTSNHHVLRELAKTRRVLWLNSLGQRTPDVSSRRDVARAGRKLREFALGPVNVESDLWVFTPLVLPLPHRARARLVNASIVRATLRSLRDRLQLGRWQLWSFLPTAAPYLGVAGEALSVYYCVDEHSMFSTLPRGTAAAERDLLERVDVVFAVNEALAERKRAANPETHVARHGVDHALFSRALDPLTRVPADIASLPRPLLGFYGTLQDWVDFELLAELARRRPHWSIALIGDVQTDTAPLAGLANVHLLGRRRNDELPAYCKGFDVGLIPYRRSAQLRFRNPIKLREYLAAGLPVISTAVPEVRRYTHLGCAAANGGHEFLPAVEEALASDSATLRAERSRAMTGETWPARVAEIERVVEDVAARRRLGALEAPAA